MERLVSDFLFVLPRIIFCFLVVGGYLTILIHNWVETQRGVWYRMSHKRAFKNRVKVNQTAAAPQLTSWTDLSSALQQLLFLFVFVFVPTARLEPPSPSGVRKPPNGELSAGERWECDDVSRRCHWSLINTEDRKWGETHRGRGRWYWGDRTKNSSWVNKDPSHQPPLLLLGSELRSDFFCLTRTLITTRELILTSVTDYSLSFSHVSFTNDVCVCVYSVCEGCNQCVTLHISA